MPENLFLINTWPSSSLGTGCESVYWSLEESPVSGRMTAFMVEGTEDILEVLWKCLLDAAKCEVTDASRLVADDARDARMMRQSELRSTGVVDMEGGSAVVQRVLSNCRT